MSTKYSKLLIVVGWYLLTLLDLYLTNVIGWNWEINPITNWGIASFTLLGYVTLRLGMGILLVTILCYLNKTKIIMLINVILGVIVVSGLGSLIYISALTTP